MDNDPSADACPLDSRRGVTEVFVKRMAVMIACFCLLGHLNSLRGIEKTHRILLSIYLFFINPVYPLVTLFFDIGWAIYKKRLNAQEQYAVIGANHEGPPLEFYVAAAIGVHAGHEETEFDGTVNKTSTSLLQLDPSLPVRERRPHTRARNRIGRLFILAVAGVQCAATVLLGIRREMRGAATVSDRRYYLFALSGLAILAQTLVIQMLPHAYSARPMSSIGVLSFTKLSWSFFTEILHYVVSLSILLFFTWDPDFYSSMMIVACLALNPVLLAWNLINDWDTFIWEGLRKLSREGPKAVIEQLALGISLFFALLAVLGGPLLWTFYLCSYNPRSDHFLDEWGRQIPTYVHCPSLWKDPLADLLWVF